MKSVENERNAHAVYRQPTVTEKTRNHAVRYWISALRYRQTLGAKSLRIVLFLISGLQSFYGFKETQTAGRIPNESETR